MARCLISLVLWVILDVHTQATIKTIEIKGGSNSIVCAVKVCISAIIMGYSEDVRLQGFRNIEAATSIVRIDILNQIVVVECETFYRAVYVSESLIYLLLFSVFRIGSFNFVAKVGGYFYDDIIIRVDVFGDISVVIIRVYIFEDVVAVRSSRIIDNFFKKAR